MPYWRFLTSRMIKNSEIPHDSVSSSGRRDSCGQSAFQQYEWYSCIFRVYGGCLDSILQL